MSWFSWNDDELTLRLRIQPKAARDRFVGPYGEDQYKVTLTAPPVDGQANKHLIKFLSNSFGLPRSRITLVSGETSRTKCLKLKSPTRLPIPVGR
ncbi:MAG: DUF167 family protein [Candidatus Thiodiazotropha sp.]|jgi:uncharacterized protein